VEFADIWLWLIFVIAGLLLVLLELIIGIDTGLDMVFIGSVFIIGGLTTWPAESWVLTLLVTIIICVAYVFLGRRYIHRLTYVKKTKTNIDTIAGQMGIVLKDISKNADGLVKVGNEEWRARAEEDIKQGEEITVTGISGVTLEVRKK
jgi:membrane protein implicated in regulation of membrane protease activity